METLIVVDDEFTVPESLNLPVTSFSTYLKDYPKKGERRLRLINLCDTQHYLSKGYYCSLLAEAREHRALPTVNTINDLRHERLSQWRFDQEQQKALDQQFPDHQTREFLIAFGQSPTDFCAASALFQQFPAPLLRVVIEYHRHWQLSTIQRLGLSALDEQEQAFFWQACERYAQQRWPKKSSRRLRWDLAILHDPQEVLPPSDQAALKRMVKAAEKVGIRAELIVAEDYPRLNEFDALFIRETTAIDHHTYQFARKAEREGLVVMDDPQSILRCCNKVYLQDAFSYHGVSALPSCFVSEYGDELLDQLISDYGLPLVLKIPESAFSKGVYKAENREQLQQRLQELLADSALVLVQSYCYTEFDWRIGVLNNRPLYACKYYMAKGHWQIYNHQAAKQRFQSGSFQTLPTYEVPKVVLDVALKACKAVGDGLYGVDIKQQGNQAWVIEVNDNPSLDHGVEDAYLGEELYMLLMSEFARRLELRGRSRP